MGKQKENMKPEKYGNVTFGEASKLLVDIIGQNAILDLMPEKEHKAYKRHIQRMYKGQTVYQRLAAAEPESPQWYFAQFFEGEKGLEKKYGLPHLAMILVDSFTWQFFHALISHTPFEKTKQETALYLARKELFNLVYRDLIKKYPLSNGSISHVSKDSIIHFLTDIDV
jgi:hypothetical protein